jgi:hypothetical protein
MKPGNSRAQPYPFAQMGLELSWTGGQQVVEISLPSLKAKGAASERFFLTTHPSPPPHTHTMWEFETTKVPVPPKKQEQPKPHPSAPRPQLTKYPSPSDAYEAAQRIRGMGCGEVKRHFEEQKKESQRLKQIEHERQEAEQRYHMDKDKATREKLRRAWDGRDVVYFHKQYKITLRGSQGVLILSFPCVLNW